jgi:hypothetical protein
MKLSIFLIITLSSFLFMGCPIDNKVGAKFSKQRIIKNTSDYEVKLQLFYEGNKLDTVIFVGDSVIFFADCEVIGGDMYCGNPNNYSSRFATAIEDSVHIIFDSKKILRYKREISCFQKNIVIAESPCGYFVEGRGTGLETYTYEITQEDYNNAEDIGG